MKLKLKDQKILITGGAGFIGSNLTDYFLENDNEVTVIDDFSTGILKNLENAKKSKNFFLIRGDIRDETKLKKIIQDVDYIFHQAAIASVPLSIKDPVKTNDVNVNGTLNILHLAKNSDIKRIVFASSSSVYGEVKTLPIKEDDIVGPISPYGVSKLSAESYLLMYQKVFGVKVTILRYFNVYGKRQIDSPYSGVIPIWFGKLLRNESPVIFGDGFQRRDFIYIRDIIQLNELAAIKKVAIGEIFNAGISVACSINELAELVIEVVGKKIDLIYEPIRNGDIKDSIASISKANKLLDYKPNYDLKKGLMELYKSNFS
ncbi:MAG: SDR family NAD(P)-dependent oxidoreductase [Candidatus Lokiarchaeota archaeon]|nr:SDR family NAD(P)-dependent oxidoreductase [Candidatus Lokiarchaeota archaeon]